MSRNAKKYYYNLLNEWKMSRSGTVITLRYPKEGDFYPFGFVKRHSGAADWMDFEGLYLTLSAAETEAIKIEIHFAGRECVSCRRILPAGERQEIHLCREDFPIELSRENDWQFVTAVEIDTQAELLSCEARRREAIYADFPVRGKSGEPGEEIVYEGRIYNCFGEKIIVAAAQLYEGWESLKADILLLNENQEFPKAEIFPINESPCPDKKVWRESVMDSFFVLNPGERRKVAVKVKIHENMVPGGHEDTVIAWRAQGTRDSVEKVIFKSMRTLPHPYLYHNQSGWKAVMEKIEKYPMYQPAWENYRKLADEWNILPPYSEEDYCYPTQEENHIMACAYCYAFTGDISYARKLAHFFREFTDCKKGYPAKKKGCSQSYVQEGHFFQHMAIAYDMIHDSGVLSQEKDPVFGHPELPMETAGIDSEGAFADNIGIAMLRSRTKGRSQREQIQAVLRYGSHGNAHGHFDICDLLSVMRYGRSFFNPENCWWGYAHFMYKFYVQCSLTKNMVVVDDKMQIPADSRRILFYRGRDFQAAGVEVTTCWAYPPYGGMVYYQDGQRNTREELKKRCKLNCCWLPEAEDTSVVYGDMSGYTEPVRQRRIMVVTDDYIVLFDTLEGEEEHIYDSLMQIKGFCGIEGNAVTYTQHTEQMSENPISDAQFITDCHWYGSKDTSVAHFETVFTEEMREERQDCDRTNYNEPGVLKMDVHTAWPKQSEQMVGRVAVYHGWAASGNGYTIPLSYRVETDGETVAEGAFDAWILGREECSIDVRGRKKLSLVVKNGVCYDETGHEVRTPQALFWGEAYFECGDGSIIRLSELPYTTRNIDSGKGIGKDYMGGRVTIVGTEYPYAIPTSPLDHDREGRIEVDLSTLNAVRFVACIGCDAFPGDEWQKRKTYAVRTRGKNADFATVIESFETQSAIQRVEANGPKEVCVTLKDGRIQKVTLLEDVKNHTFIKLETVDREGQVHTEVSDA